MTKAKGVVSCDAAAWKGRVLRLLSTAVAERKECWELTHGSGGGASVDMTKAAKCDCWSMLRGESAPDALLERCGYMPAAHVLQIVGWGVDEKTGVEYWTLQNSWGPFWGDGGYFKMERGVGMWGVEDEMYAMTPAMSKVVSVDGMHMQGSAHHGSSSRTVVARTRR